MTSLVQAPRSTRRIADVNWQQKSLRQCLKALGLSDHEMRYSGCPLMISWAGNLPELIELVKRTWKQQVVKVHEATGNDPHQWKMLNIVYSATLKKISKYQRKTDKRVKTITFTCHVCNKSVTKKYVSRFQNKSFLCDNIDCIREYRRRKQRRLRQRDRVIKRMVCANDQCDKEFNMSDGRGRKRFCSDLCRMDQWRRDNEEKLKAQSKASHERRMAWKDWYAGLTEEQKEVIRVRTIETRRKRFENESPEKQAERRAKLNARMKAYRLKRKAEGRPITSKYIRREDWLAKKKEELKDKPWIYETLLQKYQRPDGTISSVAIK